ncbi:MAG TPA: hypothetical protein VNQ53_15675 [Nocardioides sp.]|nr:hypothetical protein [Nocardioides sp.]
MTRNLTAVLFAVLALSLAGCGEQDDVRSGGTGATGSTDLEFTASGGCGDAYFWATTADDEHAIVVSVDLSDRSASGPTVVDVSLPDPAVEIELWEGTGLGSLMCNDVIEGEVTDETPVVEGAGTITVQPRPEGDVDFVDGKLELTGLVAEDGTDLPDLAIKTTSIGFYAG